MTIWRWLLASCHACPARTPTAWSLGIAIGLLALALLLPDHASDQAVAATGVQRVAITPARGRVPISLRDRLLVGLQARIDTEVAFVERVVLKVNTGKLPERVVDQTFFWARQRAAVGRSGRPRRPIIFFQPAMIARAKRLGIEL
jgi:hypothetical protein